MDRSSSAVRLEIAERERTLRESAEADGRVKANDVDAEQVAATAEQLARRAIASWPRSAACGSPGAPSRLWIGRSRGR
jgi:hypothetical protein